ncbi:MAG: cytochrome c oxidase subunit II [Acidobacteria bacterium]|nr:cytochrome c oxidase subunit II [Acidobacteriota bacterium]
MEEKATVKSGRSGEGLFLALLIWLMVIVTTALFFKRAWWLPTLASDRGGIDGLFFAILIVTGIAFVVVQAMLGYFLWRFSDRSVARAAYWHESRPLEITWTLGTTVILSILILVGLRLWTRVFSAPPDDALPVEVTGQQFEWTSRYPGKDGAFGRTDPKLFSPDNRLGLDEQDPASKDDIVLVNQLYLPVDRPARVRLRSKDMLHSFFLPNFRVKQDTVPGMTVENWFVPTKEGDYEIACAELCGLGHYKMRGLLHVLSQEGFEKWLAEQGP